MECRHHNLLLFIIDESCSVLQLVSCCFKPREPQWITSGLKETFIKGYIAERTNKAEIRLEQQSEKAESCRENLRKEIQLKGS